MSAGDGVKAFVAGATGYTGREVVRALVRAGADTVAHVRPDSPWLAEWRARFQDEGARPDATPWEEAALGERLRALQPTHVFALLGTTRARAAAARRAGAPPADYENVDFGLTVMLLHAAAACPADAAGRRPRFVYLSAIGARADTSNRYMQVRGRVEALVRASPLPYLIVRPGFISGGDREERRPLERILATSTDIGTALLGTLGARRLRARLRPRSGEELARAIVRLALAGREGVVEAEEL
ncbi:MAG TPA: NAD(P)H-binding protein [Longimicrobiales bacterium]